jgi:hypothetical protein
MIEQKEYNNQLPKEIKSVFNELNISEHLRQAGFKKSIGFTCLYLFQLVFFLIFHHKNWFRLLESKKRRQFPAKDAAYRFLNYSKFSWRRFLLTFSSYTINVIGIRPCSTIALIKGC